MLTDKPKTLMIIGAGIESYEGIQVAKNMGLKLIVADGSTSAPGLELADCKLNVSTYDGEKLLEHAKTLIQKGWAIDGVISMCADVPLSVATITNSLGLPGLSIESAFLVSDKLAMKDALSTANIPIPKYQAVNQYDDPNAIASTIGLPLVVKPVDSRGARGVQLVDDIDDIIEAIKHGESNSPTARAMVEEYIVGPQISTETLIENGDAFTIGFSDRNYADLNVTKPYFIENGGDAPSKLSQQEKDDVIQTVERAAKALEIHQGVAKGDMVLSPEGAKVIEIAGRLSGGYFSTVQIPLATGINFIECAIKLCLDEKLDRSILRSDNRCGVAIRYLPFKPGIVKHITGLDAAKQFKGVELLKLFIKEGSKLEQLENHTQRAGFVICTAPTKAEAIDRANQALSHIEIHYE